MNVAEFLLNKASEEASEVAVEASMLAKEVLKVARFSFDSTYTGVSNRQRIVNRYLKLREEMVDLQAALALLGLTDESFGGLLYTEAEEIWTQVLDDATRTRLAQRIASNLGGSVQMGAITATTHQKLVEVLHVFARDGIPRGRLMMLASLGAAPGESA